MQTIFVVFERDRGFGYAMLRAFTSYEEAITYIREIGGDYIEEVELQQ
jgi:hypothetical protein